MFIKKLPKKIINFIAAGQIVQDPASVVKELVENSIDAKSKNIKILLEDSGLKKITIIDDGIGINKDDLELAIQKNTTSKIEKFSDLYDIKTLGFRGEALFSILQVSQLTIKSKTKNSKFGYQIDVKDQTVSSIKPVSMSDGTTIIVKDLFYNTPVRKKILKSLNIELKKIVKKIFNLAIAYPKISFFLSNNQKEIIDLPSQSLNSRLRLIFGIDIFKEFIPIKIKTQEFKINGFISSHNITTKSKDKQFLFINNRPVKDTKIASSIKQAYSQFVKQYDYPIFILKIDIDPTFIDIHIDPQKQSIKILNIENITSTLQNNIQLKLYEHIKNQNLTNVFFLKKNSTAKNSLDKDKLKININNELNIKIFKLNRRYCLLKIKNNILLVDIYRALKRIYFDKFQNSFNLKNIEKIDIIPLIIDISQIDKNILEQNLSILNKIGFDLELFYQNTIKIYSLPKFINTKNKEKIKSLLYNIIDEIKTNKNTEQNFNSLFLNMSKYLAKQKLDENLDEKYLLKIIKNELFACKNPIKDPNANNIYIYIKNTDLEKLINKT